MSEVGSPLSSEVQRSIALSWTSCAGRVKQSLILKIIEGCIQGDVIAGGRTPLRGMSAPSEIRGRGNIGVRCSTKGVVAWITPFRRACDIDLVSQ